MNARTETSGPVRNSSITMLLPLSPKILSPMIVFTAFFASSRVCAIITPFPRASPSALTTIGAAAFSTYASAFFISEKLSYAAVGIPYFFMSCFEKTLLPSIIAAFLSGPNVFMPLAFSASTAPSTSGSSGATTAKSILFSTANFTMPSISFAPIGTHSASAAIPPFPGRA